MAAVGTEAAGYPSGPPLSALPLVVGPVEWSMLRTGPLVVRQTWLPTPVTPIFFCCAGRPELHRAFVCAILLAGHVSLKPFSASLTSGFPNRRLLAALLTTYGHT